VRVTASGCIGVFLLIGSSLSAEKPEWDNPSIINIGTERPHTTMMVYPTPELARKGGSGGFGWFQLFNGEWKFHRALRPAERPIEFYRTDFSSWEQCPFQRAGNARV
jgi:beta-galactosidase